MRTHGWSGATPTSDDEAVERLVAAAKESIDRGGPDLRIADVARSVGVTRQTVYRYFPSTEALLAATALSEIGPFLEDLQAHMSGIHDPAEAAVEGIAYVLERLPEERYLNLVLAPGKASDPAAVTSDLALSFGRMLFDKYDIDWRAAGFSGSDMDELTEHTLRILQSFVVDPGRPPRRGDDLRGYLRRWVAPAISGKRPRTRAPRA